MRPPGIALLAAAVAAGISASSAQKIRVCADAGQRSQECGASNASRPQLCCRGLVCSGSMAAGQAYRCVEGGDGAGGDGAGGDDTATATDISNISNFYQHFRILQSNLAIRNGLIRNKLVLRNHFL